MAKIIRVMVVDDHEQVRLALRMALELFDDVEIVAEAPNGQEAVALCRSIRPHVILMDLVMPHMNGVTATAIIHHTYPQIKIIVLTSTVEVELLESALDAGAEQYLLKNVRIEELVNAIRRVAQNQGESHPAPLPKNDQASRSMN